MNDPHNTQSRAQTTEQIVAAGTLGNNDRTSSDQHPPHDEQTQQPGSAQAAARGDLGMGDQPHAQLLADGEGTRRSPGRE